MNPDTESEEQAISTRMRILVADDVQETRRSARLILSLNPDVEIVGVVRNGQQAIDMAATHKPDIVILDINMPKVDGLSALRVMRQTNPNLACIIISAEMSDRHKSKLWLWGCANISSNRSPWTN